MKTLTVLLTAGGAPGWPSISQSILKNGERKIRLIATDLEKHKYGMYKADASYLVPRGDAPDYIRTVLKIVAKEKIDVIMPAASPELVPLAKNIRQFEKLGCKVAVSEASALEIAEDKAKLYQFLKEYEIPTPEFRLVKNTKEFKKAVKDLGYPKNPVCFKPAIAHGSRGFRILNPNVDKFDLFLNQKPDSTLTTYEEALIVLESAERKKMFPQLIVMEFVQGPEYSVDLLLKNRKVVYSIPRKRSIIRQGICAEGTIEENKSLIKVSTKIAELIGLDYNINMQFILGSDGVPKIIEINPRLSGTIILCVGAGVNMPYFGIKAALDEKIPKVTPKWGTSLIRHWGELFVDKTGHAHTL